jgi:translation initiation factor 1 (eIF-1/SUI1)
METNAKNNNGAVKGINTVKADKKPQFVAGNPVNAVSKKAEEKEEPNTAKTEAVKPAEPVQGQEQAEQPKEAAKAVWNLDETIKLLEILHIKKVQRDKVITTINNLEAFNVDLEKEADETGGNHYQGCVLKINDDERREFITKNPVIIQAVAQFVNSLCVDKLAEIEAGIIIPA